jgi:putative FmdB family regulatory protein
MPIYEYECANCQKIFSDFRPMNMSSEANKCECGADARRIISKTNWKPFIGSVEYDRRNGYVFGQSAIDNRNQATEDW